MLCINDIRTENLSIDEAVTLLKGDEDIIKLKLKRDDPCTGKLMQRPFIDEYLSHVMRKFASCICGNNCADQLCGNHTAGQRLCFRYIDSTISLLSLSEISSL